MRKDLASKTVQGIIDESADNVAKSMYRTKWHDAETEAKGLYYLFTYLDQAYDIP